MKILAGIALVWLVCLAIGATFGILGKIIWLAILVSLAAMVWGYIDNKDNT